MIEWLDTNEDHDRLTWTVFDDGHSGGGTKFGYEYIYIQAPEARAIEIFEERFGRPPHGTTCTCCGPDFFWEETTDGLARVTSWHRRVEIVDGIEIPMPDQELFGLSSIKLTEYCEQDDVLVIYTRTRGEDI